MSERVRPEPAKYKTTNWRHYNQALKSRGALMIWLDRDMQWSSSASGKRGRAPTFSDAAIQFCLTIKVRIPYRPAPQGLHLLVDSTGLKMIGEGEWKRKKHRAEYRRQWRKLHLGIDAETMEIRAVEVTTNSVGDAPMLPALLGQIDPTEALLSVSADGAYDTKACHEAIARCAAQAIIPVRKNARRPWKESCPGASVLNEILRATH